MKRRLSLKASMTPSRVAEFIAVDPQRSIPAS